MCYQKPNRFYYAITQAVAWIAAKAIYRRKFLRNEIKNKKGPFVVIANHQSALDFVNLIGATRRPLTFVISSSFFNTLPFNPGKYLEFQHGDTIYRCMPEDGRQVMKFINMVKVLYRQSHGCEAVEAPTA